MKDHMVLREQYLARLQDGKDATDVVKVVTGMRRCGKSTLMMQYIDRLKSLGVPEGRIIYANLESRQFEDISDSKGLSGWLAERMPKDRAYVLLDEVQRIKGWEKTVNSLQADYDADIYVTGSNAYLLSSDLATYISGRYVEIRMLPLSFKEFLELNPPTAEEDRSRRLQQYIQTGSLPAVELDRDEQYTSDLLLGIYNTVVRKDIQTHIGVRDQTRFENITRFVMSNIGNTTSCKNIADAVNASPNTVNRYLRALEDAFLIYKAPRFDIRGKKLLKTKEKYYVADTGIRNTALGLAAGDDISRQLENLVYLELVRRGYRVMVGSWRNREVDFTAVRNGEAEYYQVAQTMLPEDVFEREVRSLRDVDDNFPKTVLSLDSFLVPIGGGIRHRNLIEWLLDARSPRMPSGPANQRHYEGGHRDPSGPGGPLQQLPERFPVQHPGGEQLLQQAPVPRGHGLLRAGKDDAGELLHIP